MYDSRVFYEKELFQHPYLKEERCKHPERHQVLYPALTQSREPPVLYSPIVYVTYEYAEPVNQYQSAEVHTHSRTNPYLYNQVKYEPKLKIYYNSEKQRPGFTQPSTHNLGKSIATSRNRHKIFN